MSPPHALQTAGNGSEEGELAEVDGLARSRATDDFDSVFGEASPAARRPSPRKTKDATKVETSVIEPAGRRTVLIDQSGVDDQGRGP